MADPCLLAIVLGAPIVLITAGLQAASDRPLPRRKSPLLAERVLQAAAQDLGLQVEDPGSEGRLPSAIGAIEGHEVDLRVVLRGEGLAVITVRVDGLPAQVACRAAGGDPGEGHATGDPIFDAEVVFEAPVEEGATWLPGTTRRALLDLVRAGGEVRSGRLAMHVGAEGLTVGGIAGIGDAAGLVRRVRRALDVARELGRGPVPLRQVVATDLDPGARVFALDELVRLGAADRAWLGELARRDDEVAVRAAVHLGDAERLRAMLTGPACREALLALAEARSEPDPSLEAAFRRLIATAPDPDLLAAAAEVGPVGLVPVLLGVGPPLEREAGRAVAAVQARSTGLKGGLALVGGSPEEGRLSVAEAAGGRLAETDRSG